MGDVYDRCNKCTRLRKLHNGLCDDCATFIGATNGGSIFGPGFNDRPTCKACGGLGKIIHHFGPDEKCLRCDGTGKE